MPMQTQAALPRKYPGTNLRTPPSVIATIIAISAVASLFLAWLVYYHPPVDLAGTRLAFLPALDAILNALCAVFLIVGFRFIRRRQIIAHRNSMFGAFVVSSVFLVAYVVNHVLHGDMLFPKAFPTARFIYLWLLLTPHIFLAIVCLPMILITFFLSLTGRFPAHRRLARWTYPIWLYVSVSGVVVYAMLALYR
jgi:putative membrane protein